MRDQTSDCYTIYTPVSMHTLPRQPHTMQTRNPSQRIAAENVIFGLISLGVDRVAVCKEHH